MSITSLSDIKIESPKPEYLEEAYRLFCSHRLIPWSFELFTQSIISPFSLVAVMNGKVIAYVIINQRADEADIEDICVASTHREQGIGSAILQACLQRISKADVHTVYLEVRETNTAAQQLYRNTGFSFTGERKNYFTNQDGSKESAMLYQWLGGR